MLLVVCGRGIVVWWWVWFFVGIGYVRFVVVVDDVVGVCCVAVVVGCCVSVVVIVCECVSVCAVGCDCLCLLVCVW